MDTYNNILKKYSKYIKTIAISFNKDKYLDDLFQAGSIGLYRAYETYNKDKGKFHNYAMRMIKFEMWDFLSEYSRMIRLPNHAVNKILKEELKETYVESFETPINHEKGILSDIIVENINEDKDYTLLNEIINELKPKYRDIVRMYYYEDMNAAQISRQVGCSRENIRTKLVKIKRKLKEKFENKSLKYEDF